MNDLVDRRRWREAIDDPDEALTFLQAIYRNSEVALSVRMRAAIEALPYEKPRLAVTANITGADFASMLDRAIERSGKGREVKQIEGNAIDITPQR